MYRSVSVSSAQEEATVAPGVLRIVLDDLPGRNDLSDLDGGDHPFRTRHLRHGVLAKQDPLVGALPNQIQEHFISGHALFPALAEVTQVHAFWEAPDRQLRPVLTLCRCQLSYCTGRYACGKAGDCVQSDDL